MIKQKNSSSLSRDCFAVELSSSACQWWFTLGLWHKLLPGIGDVLETLQQEPLWPTLSLCGSLKHQDLGAWFSAKNQGWCDGAHRGAVGRKARWGECCMDHPWVSGTAQWLGQGWKGAVGQVAKAETTPFTLPAAPQEEAVPKLKLLTEKTDITVKKKRPKKPGSAPAVLLWWLQLQQCLLGGGAAPSRRPLGFPQAPTDLIMLTGWKKRERLLSDKVIYCSLLGLPFSPTIACTFAKISGRITRGRGQKLVSFLSQGSSQPFISEKTKIW